jgi:succinyl-CoA synthetase alpha subunit
MVEQIGGTDEESTAEYIKEHGCKPYIAYLAGSSAPSDQQI